MLVFTRRVDEAIMIGDNIRIMVVGIHGGKVRLGFSAPPSVSVIRQELNDNQKPSDSSSLPADATRSETDPGKSR